MKRAEFLLSDFEKLDNTGEGVLPLNTTFAAHKMPTIQRYQSVSKYDWFLDNTENPFLIPV